MVHEYSTKEEAVKSKNHAAIVSDHFMPSRQVSYGVD
jgi:hypothetical protein